MAYPSSIDSFPVFGNNTPSLDNHRDMENAQAAAIVAIETELGINPSGTSATVAERFDAAVPPGVVTDFAGSVAPTGWLLCDGSEVLRATYPALDGVIGTLYGAYTNGSGGVGTTHMRLPNAKGRVSAARDAAQTEFDALGKIGGAKTVILIASEMPSHAHGINDSGHQHTSGVPRGGGGWTSIIGTTGANDHEFGITPYYTGVSGTGISIQAAGGNGAHNNLQPFITFNKIIKT